MINHKTENVLRILKGLVQGKAKKHIENYIIFVAVISIIAGWTVGIGMLIGMVWAVIVFEAGDHALDEKHENN